MPVVLFLDLDDFKVVNDTLGHAAGDRLLFDVAARLRTVLRSEDVAARLGGDEFAVLLEDDPGLSESEAVAHRIIEAMRVAFSIDGHDTTIGASIGIAAARLGTERADELLRNADVAMYTAKASGKNRVSVFEPTMHAAIVERHALSAELSRSLGQGELAVYYQPIVTLSNAEVTGMEALVRWRHPVRGLIGPGEFVHLAEENGMILPLGRWVLSEACRQAAAWSRLGPSDPPLTMSVNLSAQQLQEPTFVSDLKSILEESGLTPWQLVLEMTETVMFHDTTTTISRLEAIRDLGVRIAIDDFGTGYSSLGYLRRFRVDILKIAREFIGPAESEEEWAFAGAIVALGRTLGLSIIAEGIEEPGQYRRLHELGCEYGQGYLFSTPAGGGCDDRDADGRAAAAGVAPAHREGAPGRVVGPDRRSRRQLSSTESAAMFILYAVLIGLVVGFLAGGRLSGLAAIQLRWSWVIVAGLLVQVVLFSEPVSARIGSLGPPVYVASTAAVIGAVLANRAITGMLIVALGAIEQPRRDRRERWLHAGGSRGPDRPGCGPPDGLLQ